MSILRKVPYLRTAGISVLALFPYSAVNGADTTAANKKLQTIEEVVVTAHPLSGDGLSQASSVLSGDELARKVSTNIGTTLGREPGIHAAQFGNAVGRPVIHGLGGSRVRIMEDRIDTLDVSVTSADHSVGVEPFIAERVEVLKGASTLLYGPGAIGGVVNVQTGRIPHRNATKALSGGIESRYDNNTHGFSTAAKLNGGFDTESGHLAWHADGTWKEGDEYEIPGFAESSILRALEEAEAMPGDPAEEEVRGVLPGSDFDFTTYAGGFSFMNDWGLIGLSVSETDADYGLPGGHAEEEDANAMEPEEEGNPSLSLQQTRTDFELNVIDPFAAFSSLNIRVGHNDYEHREIEPNGEVATLFTNKAWEMRAELLYENDTWKSVLGLQHTNREFSATGEEAFVPPVDTIDSGIFWVIEKSYQNFDLEGGLRVGQVEHDPQNMAKERFTTYAGSIGLVMPLSETLELGVLADYSSRSPVAEELFSNGPHLVTNAFELGNPDLDNERAANITASLRFTGTRIQGSLTTYITQFDNFIFEQANGAMEDGLPVFQFQQDDALFIGAEAELR